MLEYMEARNRGDLEGVRSTFGPEAQIYGVLGWGDVAKARVIWADLIYCFRIQLQVESLIAAGEIVAVRYTEQGKSKESLRKGPITGKS